MTEKQALDLTVSVLGWMANNAKPNSGVHELVDATLQKLSDEGHLDRDEGLPHLLKEKGDKWLGSIAERVRRSE